VEDLTLPAGVIVRPMGRYDINAVVTIEGDAFATPARRGEGLGKALLLQVLGVARERGVQQLFLEVRASNEVAIDLYLRQGFEEVGVRRNYYGHPPEDAKVMLAAIG
jgi:ribosomal protein S18 acetylase RimI-like enzyme